MKEFCLILSRTLLKDTRERVKEMAAFTPFSTAAIIKIMKGIGVRYAFCYNNKHTRAEGNHMGVTLTYPFIGSHHCSIIGCDPSSPCASLA
jgi:hypothetical protein